MSAPIITPLAFIAPPGRRAHNLTRAEIVLNQQLARQWRADNPGFFTTDPLALRDPGGLQRGPQQIRANQS